MASASHDLETDSFPSSGSLPEEPTGVGAGMQPGASVSADFPHGWQEFYILPQSDLRDQPVLSPTFSAILHSFVPTYARLSPS